MVYVTHQFLTFLQRQKVEKQRYDITLMVKRYTEVSTDWFVLPKSFASTAKHLIYIRCLEERPNLAC